MLYLIDKYIAEYPHRKIPELLRFGECSKNLHEMTLNEVNAIVSTWNAVIASTAENTMRKIAQYLEWLEDQGEKISFDVRKVEFPIKENTENYSVFSTRDIQKHYDTLYTAIDRKAAKTGLSGSTSSLLRCHAAGILAFYGLSDEEILQLDLSDVQPDGVIGYDLPLTKEDIEILLKYKNLQQYDNNKNLKGTKYIRNGNGGNLVGDMRFLNRPLVRAEIDEQYSYLKSLLKTSQLNLLGRFDRAYKEEKCREDKILVGKKAPQWFADILHLQGNWLLKKKHEYIAYRDLRDKQFSEDLILKRIEEIDDSISKLNKEKEGLQDLLH